MARQIADRLDDSRKAQLLAAMPGLKERAKTLVELADGAAFLFAERPLAARREGCSPARSRASAEHPARCGSPRLKASTANGPRHDGSGDPGYSQTARDMKLGAVAQPLRAALTGSSTSPGVFDVLAVLGREESLARIADQID